MLTISLMRADDGFAEKPGHVEKKEKWVRNKILKHYNFPLFRVCINRNLSENICTAKVISADGT